MGGEYCIGKKRLLTSIYIYIYIYILYYIERALAKGKQKYTKKKSHLSPDPVKRKVGEKKQGMNVQFIIGGVLTLLF